MKRVLVPVLTSEDIAALPALAAYLASVRPEYVVVLNNPSVGVTAETLTAEIDKQLADLEKSKADAVAREDFEGAKGWKVRIEETKMERTTLLRDGWKKVPENLRFAAYDKFLEPLKVALGPVGSTVQNIPLSEDTSHEELFGTLSQLSRAWIPGLPFGKFVLLPPQGAPELRVPEPQQAVSVESKVNTPVAPPKAVQKAIPAVSADPREARAKELSRFMKLKAVAKEKGISMTDRPWQEVREEILALEFPVAA
jgi:hypothetical protein